MRRDPILGPALFDAEATFDEDYAYFAEVELTDERTAREADTVWRLLDLHDGAVVLDLGCGPGRMAAALARKGARVTGVDRSERLVAWAGNATRELAVRYVVGDMRLLPWKSRFEAILLWNTSFGYFGEDDNLRALVQACEALKPGGRLLIDQAHRAALLGRSLPAVDIISRGEDRAFNVLDFDPRTERLEMERILIRAGRMRRLSYSVRLYGAPEMACLLREAGFASSRAYGYEGGPLQRTSPALITVCRK